MPSDLPDWLIAQRVQVGHRIRDLRIQRGLSQEQLAHEAGIARHTVYRTELATHSASLDALGLIAETLGVPLWRLFRDE
ncbi:helix-turn-helix domain-containing protein [Kitasatospora sp. RB6PN24]|uniref:helix-turn-helix transcriptional regulator n=1 Tax=Kitasatospora humi TaxID=2893891 RepID=UPI001E3C200E|nr:helix-turn-helix domain-containing protein [Kitasatospora humi]MCC9307656.1 helix-turn-helix domain-containing protein [Kitasatospora humi]